MLGSYPLLLSLGCFVYIFISLLDINRFDIIIYKTLLFSFFVIFFIILSLFCLMGYVAAIRVSGNLKSNF